MFTSWWRSLITSGRAAVVTGVSVTNQTLLQTARFQKLEQWEDLLLFLSFYFSKLGSQKRGSTGQM